LRTVPGPRFLAPLLAALLVSAGPAAASAVRYAGPSGSGTACTNATPCSFETAVESAGAGDEIVVKSGSYTVADKVDGQSLLGLDIHGAPGLVRPTVSITAPTNNPALLLGGFAHVHDLNLVSGGTPSIGLFTDGGLTLEDVSISAPTAGSTAVWLNAQGSIQSTIRNAMIRAGDTAITTSDANVVIRNVTGIATGPNSYGLAANALGGAPRIVNVRDSIFQAAGYDLYMQGSDQTIDADYSEYSDFTLQANGKLTAGAHNVHVAPTFVSPTDLHVTAASAGNDVGTTDFFTLGTDVDGDPRPLGAFPDIGADEFRTVQTASTTAATAVDTTTATLNGTINPQNETVNYQFEYGPTTSYGHVTPIQAAPAGATDQAVSSDVAGLTASTGYHFRLVTANGYNAIAVGADQGLTTKDVPPAATPDPVPGVQPGSDPDPSIVPPVGDGPGPAPVVRPARGCRVPKLKGLTLAKARRNLKKAGCRLGKVTGHGRVRRQSVRAGRKRARGAKIRLTLRPRQGQVRDVRSG
jgi:hypothetical protein